MIKTKKSFFNIQHNVRSACNLQKRVNEKLLHCADYLVIQFLLLGSGADEAGRFCCWKCSLGAIFGGIMWCTVVYITGCNICMYIFFLCSMTMQCYYLYNSAYDKSRFIIK